MVIPVHHQRGARVVFKFPALARLVVGDEPHDARGRCPRPCTSTTRADGTALGVAGGQHHGVRVGLFLAADGLGEPFGDQWHGIGGQGVGQRLIGYHAGKFTCPYKEFPRQKRHDPRGTAPQLNQLDGELLALIARRQAISREGGRGQASHRPPHARLQARARSDPGRALDGREPRPARRPRRAA